MMAVQVMPHLATDPGIKTIGIGSSLEAQPQDHAQPHLPHQAQAAQPTFAVAFPQSSRKTSHP